MHFNFGQQVNLNEINELKELYQEKNNNKAYNTRAVAKKTNSNASAKKVKSDRAKRQECVNGRVDIL